MVVSRIWLLVFEIYLTTSSEPRLDRVRPRERRKEHERNHLSVNNGAQKNLQRLKVHLVKRSLKKGEKAKKIWIVLSSGREINFFFR